MKKLMFLFVCLIGILLTGCVLHNPKHSSVFIVTKISITKNANMALYTVKEQPHYSLKDKYMTFFDNKHKFVVGDTVSFVKRYNY